MSCPRPPLRLILIAGAVLSIGWTIQAQAPVDWIRGTAVRLTTPEAGNGFGDLRPLKAIIGDARIVSLGEATHGTREFFQIKHRMLEFLASEMGFTIFSIEANMPEAYRLNDYVLNGAGDPAQLLRGMYFWTWDTEEVLDMIRWMRAFNASGKGRVEFTGFDMQTPTVASQIVGSFVSRYDAPYAGTLQEAVRQVGSASASSQANAFGLAAGAFPVKEALGKRVRFSGYIKSEGITTGYAGLWWRVDGPSGTLAFDNMQTRGAKGTADWQQFVIELPVDVSARNIMFGVLMPGNGTAWFDDLAIELDGKPYLDTGVFDFGFESPVLRGLAPGGAGYAIDLDAQVAHLGRQSLRIRRTAPVSAAATAVDAKAVSSRWKDVVVHLESGRAGYRASGATGDDVEWAIQNARVVLQGIQAVGGEVSRDRSMAENVKWIADRNPKARIVLWAHNGHVAASGFGDTMGAALRRMFGAQMMVFGFAFGEGSFQAIAGSGGPLKTITVPLAPPESLDATLASAGIPLFVLDLRRAPEWFRQSRGSREIGAMYPDGDPYAYIANIVAPEAFDALFFVQKTTAARKNPGR